MITPLKSPVSPDHEDPYVLPTPPKIPPGLSDYEKRRRLKAFLKRTPAHLATHSFIYEALELDKIPTPQTRPDRAAVIVRTVVESIGDLVNPPCSVIPGTGKTNIAALLFFWPRVWLWIETFADSIDSYDKALAPELRRAVLGAIQLTARHIELQTPQASAVIGRLWRLESTECTFRKVMSSPVVTAAILSIFLGHQVFPVSPKPAGFYSALMDSLASAVGPGCGSLLTIAHRNLGVSIREYCNSPEKDESPATLLLCAARILWHLTKRYDGPRPYSKRKRSVRALMDVLHAAVSRPLHEETADRTGKIILQCLDQVTGATALPSGQHVIRHAFEGDILGVFVQAIPWIRRELRQPASRADSAVKTSRILDQFGAILCGHLVHRAVLQAAIESVDTFDLSWLSRSTCAAARDILLKFLAAVKEYGSILRGLDNGGRKNACSSLSCEGLDGCERELRSCTGCQTTAYCSRTCQKADWSSHRGYCVQTKAWMSIGIMGNASYREMDYVVALVGHELTKNRISLQAAIDGVPSENDVLIEVDLRAAPAKVSLLSDALEIFSRGTALKSKATVVVPYLHGDAGALIHCYVSYVINGAATSGDDITQKAPHDTSGSSAVRTLDMRTVRFARIVGCHSMNVSADSGSADAPVPQA